MDQADAEEATGGLDGEALGQVQGVVVAVPGEDAAVAQEFRDIHGFVIGDPNGDRGAAVVEILWVGDAVKLQAGD